MVSMADCMVVLSGCLISQERSQPDDILSALASTLLTGRLCLLLHLQVDGAKIQNLGQLIVLQYLLLPVKSIVIGNSLCELDPTEANS
eukprot:59451-Amphidinium_carterae.2